MYHETKFQNDDSRNRKTFLAMTVWVWVTLRLTVSQSVSQLVSQSVLALRPSGTRDEILVVVKTFAVL